MKRPPYRRGALRRVAGPPYALLDHVVGAAESRQRDREKSPFSFLKLMISLLSDTDEYSRISQTLLVAEWGYVLSELRIKWVDKNIICQQASDNRAKVPVGQERMMWLVAVGFQ